MSWLDNLRDALEDALEGLWHHRATWRDSAYMEVECDDDSECTAKWTGLDPGCFVDVSSEGARIGGRRFKMLGESVPRKYFRYRHQARGTPVGRWGHDHDNPNWTWEGEARGEAAAVAAAVDFMRRCGIEQPKADDEAAEEENYLDYIWHEHPKEYAETFERTRGYAPESLPDLDEGD